MLISKYLRHIVRPWDGRLEMLTFFITSKCNSKCLHCFYADNLNKSDDLTLDELKKTISSLPSTRAVLFSGGEPFMQRNLPEICEQFYTTKNTNIFSIPTNGLLPTAIYTISKEILSRCPTAIVNVNFSLDGMEKMHDTIRNVPGNFKRLLLSLDSIQKLRYENPHFFINVNSVITPTNYNEIPELMEYVKTLDVDTHSLEVIRPDYLGGTVETPPIESLKSIYKTHIINNSGYFKRLCKRRGLGKLDHFVHKIFYVGKIIYLHKNQLRVLSGKKLTFYCNAGKKAASIHANGRVGLCELLPALDDLHDNEFNVSKILKSNKADAVRREIKGSHCSCTHCVFIHKSMECDPIVSLVKIPFNYFKFIIFKRF